MSGLRVLLVEDDFILNLNLREYLLERGARVESVYCAAAAFDVIDRGRPLSALISDIDLGPGADGLAVARRARSAYPDLAIVLMSASFEPEGSSEDVPYSQFIPKPFHLDDVFRALRREMGARAA